MISTWKFESQVNWISDHFIFELWVSILRLFKRRHSLIRSDDESHSVRELILTSVNHVELWCWTFLKDENHYFKSSFQTFLNNYDVEKFSFSIFSSNLLLNQEELYLSSLKWDSIWFSNIISIVLKYLNVNLKNDFLSFTLKTFSCWYLAMISTCQRLHW